MKKSIWAVLGLFIAGVVLAEQINAIMFNPSRLGLYQQLRVTKQVKSSGNLTAGTTYVKGDTTASANSYEIVNVNAQKGTVDMRGGETEMVVNGPMNIKGGKAQFTAASTLPQLPTNTWIKADEGGLTMGAVTLNGNGNKFNTGTLRGLELGPNDIPLAPSECTGALDWVERKASNGSIYQVLAVKGCPSAAGTCIDGVIREADSAVYLYPAGAPQQITYYDVNQNKCKRIQCFDSTHPLITMRTSPSGCLTNACATSATFKCCKEEVRGRMVATGETVTFWYNPSVSYNRCKSSWDPSMATWNLASTDMSAWPGYTECLIDGWGQQVPSGCDTYWRRSCTGEGISSSRFHHVTNVKGVSDSSAWNTNNGLIVTAALYEFQRDEHYIDYVSDCVNGGYSEQTF